jgi:23S rRNA (adenine2503-C2)-methyltransferase
MEVPSRTNDTAGRVNLRSLSRGELRAFVQDLGEPAYRADQLFRWLHARDARSFDDMTDLPAGMRRRLAETARVGELQEVRRRSARDRTIKVLYRLASGRDVESVLIPDFDAETGEVRRLTVCVSSQVGCAMGCTFCATGRMGFFENLSPGDIAAQVEHLDRVAQEEFGRPVSNVVYMGMGEPLQNYDAVLRSVELLTDGAGLALSPRRVTVSTVGLAARIRRLADDDAPFGLAVSLHAPTDEQRSAIMPVNRSEKTDLGALKESIQYYHARTGRRVTYEYCVFEGVNDTPADAANLAAVTSWAPSKVNLIVYNRVEGAADPTGQPFRSPDEQRLEGFIRQLVRRGVRVTVRRSRGQDIEAACGQLDASEGSSQ